MLFWVWKEGINSKLKLQPKLQPKIDFFQKIHTFGKIPRENKKALTTPLFRVILEYINAD